VPARPKTLRPKWLRFGKAWPNRALADERSRFEAAKVEHDAREAAFGEVPDSSTSATSCAVTHTSIGADGFAHLAGPGAGR